MNTFLFLRFTNIVTVTVILMSRIIPTTDTEMTRVFPVFVVVFIVECEVFINGSSVDRCIFT